MNINDRVKVTLTEAGLEMYRKHFKKVSDSIPLETSYFDDEAKRTDAELETQLWSLFEIFHPAMDMGGDQVFKDNEIVILEDKVIFKGETQ
jgi:hypothetical protein